MCYYLGYKSKPLWLLNRIFHIILHRHILTFLLLTFSFSISATTLEEQVQTLQKQVEQLISEKEENKKAVKEIQEIQEKQQEASTDGIKLGGAVRFQYSYEGYDDDNEDRTGDLDFDTFRLGLDGSIGNVILSAEYRWFQYMDVLHHAWVGYNFTDEQQGRVGVTKVPFGIQPYASHSYFFSSNYYVGLEDDYDLGFNYTYTTSDSQLDLAFYKNDELGGNDGYVSDRSERYSYDIVGVRLEGEGIYDAPITEAAESNTFNLRYATNYNVNDVAIEVGFSGFVGQLELDASTDGDYYASALHSVINYDRWNVQLQVSKYEYDVDGMDVDEMVVGAYAFYDTIAAEATTYVANIAYSLPVEIGPISNLTFYNDYSLINDKSGNLEDTYMNVTGMAITSGGLYTYVDYVIAENQPFIGGSMAGDGDTENRFNINFGYYF